MKFIKLGERRGILEAAQEEMEIRQRGWICKVHLFTYKILKE